MTEANILQISDNFLEETGGDRKETGDGSVSPV
jgi:hypothetical protein